MIVFTSRMDTWGDECYCVKPSGIRTSPMRRLLGNYYYRPAWLLFQFPIKRGHWIKVMFLKWGRRGHYE